MPADARSHNRAWLAYGALLVAISGIAWSAIFIRWSAVPGPSSAFYRVFIASLVLIPWRIISSLASSDERRKVTRITRRACLLALGGGVFFGLDLALYNTAVMRTTATTATLFGNSAPIFVGIGTWIFFRRKPLRNFWIGLSLATAGAADGDGCQRHRARARAAILPGALMSIGAAACFAVYLLATEHVREEMDTLTFSTIAIAGSVVTLAGGLRWSSMRPSPDLRRGPGRRCVGLGLISQLGAYLGLAYALGHLPATITSVGLLAQVPLTALLAVPLLGEPLTAPYLVGGALVLAGIYVVNRPS